jgi:hypothetical protein
VHTDKAENRLSIYLRYISFYFLVVFLLIYLYMLPEDVKLGLALDARSISLAKAYTLYTCHFVHLSVNHLVNNLVAFTFYYLIFVIVAVSLCKLDFEARLFLLLSITAAPLLVSVLSMLTDPTNYLSGFGKGFSAIVSFIGAGGLACILLLFVRGSRAKALFLFMGTLSVYLGATYFVYKSFLYTFLFVAIGIMMLVWTLYRLVRLYGKSYIKIIANDLKSITNNTLLFYFTEALILIFLVILLSLNAVDPERLAGNNQCNKNSYWSNGALLGNDARSIPNGNSIQT